jgi:hypothetical protein
MIRSIAYAAFAATFILAVTPSGQAMPVAPVHNPDAMITQVAWACGPGRTRVNGVCISRVAKRQIRRCAVWGAGHVCRRWY